ncbi:MAG TPA: 4-hydroxyphenylacetate 3-hydroxylase N-terminal domain-containing protein [Chloroflexota bacterium]|nr:4-hydroxyphenylacetate 3-hydroxylase N-terminal domain-containing protein [Chloroflexota bacterium]
MALRSGEAYLASLKDDRSVWLAGERVDATSHPALAPCARAVAELYDLQCDPAHGDLLTIESPSSGQRVSLAYLMPQSVEDLARHRGMIEFIMRRTGAALGRPPDYMAIMLIGFYDVRDILRQEDPAFADNIERYFEYCRENDICITHGFGDTPRDRNLPMDYYERLKVVEERPDGIVIRGARNVATLAPYADEYLGLTAPRPDLTPEEIVYFAVPMNTRGLHVICRQPLSAVPPEDHPISAFYDEMDAMVVFDDVFIPRDRVFYLRRVDMNDQLFGRILALASYHMLIRISIKADILLGIGAAMADYLGITNQPQAQDALCALIDYRETLRGFLLAAEQRPVRSLSGYTLPNPTQVLMGRVHGMQHHAEAMQRARELCGSGLLMAPRQADLASPDVGPYVSRFLIGKDQRAPDRYRMLKLAWDYLADSFAARQLLFELHAGSTLPATKQRLIGQYDSSESVQLAKELAGITDGAVGSP